MASGGREGKREGKGSARPDSREGACAKSLAGAAPCGMAGAPRAGRRSAARPDAGLGTLLTALAAIALVLAGLVASSAFPGAAPASVHDRSAVTYADGLAEYPLDDAQETACDASGKASVEGIAMLGPSEGPFEFVLSDGSFPDVQRQVSDGSFASVVASKAAEFDEQGWSFGFLLMDLESGRGYAYRIDEEFYAASSYKAPFVTFVAEEFLETGKASLDDVLPAVIVDYYPAPESQRLGDLATQTIVESDNGSYITICMGFSRTDEYVDWVEGIGLSAEDFEARAWYPHYDVRKASMLWVHMWQYLESESSRYAGWLSGLLESTEVSPIREAAGTRVLDKAGWIGDDDLQAIADNGIVYLDGRPYLLSVLSDVPYSDDGYEAFLGLVDAIIDHAGSLDDIEGEHDAMGTPYGLGSVARDHTGALEGPEGMEDVEGPFRSGGETAVLGHRDALGPSSSR